jgi:hypothetical protein
MLNLLTKPILVLLFSIPFFVFAQSPTISRSNYFDIGDSALLYVKFDTSLWSLSAGPAGAGVAWDFSAVDFGHPSVIVDTLLFISPVGTPFYPVTNSADYSQANLAMLRKTEEFSPTNNDYNYYYVDNDSLAFLGHWAENGGTELLEDHFDNSLKEMQFPMAFGDTYMDSFVRYSFDNSGGVAHYGHGTYTAIADGYGTMVTPDGTTLSDVLRIHVTHVITDSSLFGVETYTLHKYSFYAESRKGFVLTLYMAAWDSTAVETAEYQKQTNAVTSIADRRLETKMSVYPNPSNGLVELRLGNTSARLVELYDTQGRRLKTFEVTNKSNFTFDVSNLAAGVYFLEATTGDRVVNVTKLLVR